MQSGLDQIMNAIKGNDLLRNRQYKDFFNNIKSKLEALGKDVLEFLNNEIKLEFEKVRKKDKSLIGITFGNGTFIFHFDPTLHESSYYHKSWGYSVDLSFDLYSKGNIPKHMHKLYELCDLTQGMGKSISIPIRKK